MGTWFPVVVSATLERSPFPMMSSLNGYESYMNIEQVIKGKKQQVVFLATPAIYSHWKDGKGGRA